MSTSDFGPSPSDTSCLPSAGDPTGAQLSDADWLIWARRAQQPLPLGQIGPYELLDELGRGGQGAVYKARQPGTDRIIAIKVIAQGQVGSASFRVRFEREIRTTAALRHPHIVTVYGADVVDLRPLLLMEFVDGLPVDAWADRQRESTGDHRIILSLFHKIGLAVAHAHQQGVIHRDLKPSNVLVDRQGEPHVLDFGLAQVLSPLISNPQAIEATTSFVGTPAYASPEQLGGRDGQTDTRSDVFSLGCMLYQALTGHRPSEGTSFAAIVKSIQESDPKPPSALNRALDREIDAILHRALAKDKSDRYQSMDAFSSDLLSYLENRPIQAHSPTLWYQARKLVARHRLIFGFSLVLLLLLFAWAATASVMSRKEHRARLQADAARTDAEWSAYVSAISGADAALNALNVTQAKAMLNNAPQHLRNWEWNYFRRQCDQSIRTIPVSGNIRGLAVSGDGLLLAAICDEGMIEVYDTRTLEAVVSISGAVSRVSGLQVAFVPGTSTLVYAADDHSLRLCNLPDPRTLATLIGPTDFVRGIAVSVDGVRVAAASQDGRAYLWSLPAGWQTGAPEIVAYDHEKTLDGHGDQVMAVTFNIEGTRVFTGGMDRRLIAWDVVSGRKLAEVQAHNDVVSSVVADHGGGRLMTSGYDGSIKLWNLDLEPLTPTIQGHQMGAMGASFYQNGSRVVSISWDRTVRIWDASHGGLARTLLGHEGNITSLACSPDGTALYTGDSASIRVWESADLDILKVPSRGCRIQSLAVGPADDWVVAAYGHSLPDQHMGMITLWDLERRLEVATLITNHPNPAHQRPAEDYKMALSPGGHRLATTLPGTGIYVWSTEALSDFVASRNAETAMRPQPTVLDHGFSQESASYGPSITCLAFSPDARWLAAGDSSGRLILWDMLSQKPELIWRQPKKIKIAQFVGHDSVLWAVDDQGTRFAFDPETRQRRPDPPLPEGRIRELAFDPVNNRLAIDLEGEGILLFRTDGPADSWDRGSGPPGSIDPTVAMTFSSNGTRLVTASQDRTIKIWDVETERLVTTLLGHSYFVTSLVFTHDRTRLITGSADQTIRIWNGPNLSD